MDNHFHLLIQTYNEDISKIMYLLGFIFAKYSNQEHDMKGYLFQNRFGSRMIFSNYHFKIAQAYIHNNWYEAGKEENIKNKLLCSYSSFLDQKSLFSHLDLSSSLRLYRDPDSNRTPMENFELFTKNKRNNEYNLDFEFSDYLFIIKAFSNKFQKESRWLIIIFLLRTYTEAKFTELILIIKAKNQHQLRSKYNRSINKMSEQDKEIIRERFENFTRERSSEPRAGMNAN